MNKTGQWLLTTIHSDYIVNFDDKTLMRIPRIKNPLRKDGERIPFFNIEEVKIGEGCHMLLDLLGSGAQTLRLTSDVISFEHYGNN